MQIIQNNLVRASFLVLVPLLLILAARIATFSDWAVRNSATAALLFSWVVIDVLAIAVIAKAPGFKPGVRPIIGAMALGSLVVFAGASEPIRNAILSMSPLIVAMVGLMLVYAGWSSFVALRTWQKTGSIEAATAEIIPQRLAHFLIAESRMMQIGLFSWGAKPDVPLGQSGYAYHKYLNPMLATLLALQLIEIGVVHLLVSLWSETVAMVLLALSVWGAIWLVALMKSFRLYPVLLGDDVLRVRSGSIVDCDIPLSVIADCDARFTADEIKSKSTLNLAILSSPNVSLKLAHPVTFQGFFGGERSIERVALRLDDSAAFKSRLQESLS